MNDHPDLGQVRSYFDQILKVVETCTFSILDYGCGYGALADYLVERGCEAEYYGFDILESSIDLARQVHAGKARRIFFSEKEKLAEVDYVVASGVFNVRGDHPFDTWTEYLLGSLEQFHLYDFTLIVCKD